MVNDSILDESTLTHYKQSRQWSGRSQRWRVVTHRISGVMGPSHNWRSLVHSNTRWKLNPHTVGSTKYCQQRRLSIFSQLFHGKITYIWMPDIPHNAMSHKLPTNWDPHKLLASKFVTAIVALATLVDMVYAGKQNLPLPPAQHFIYDPHQRRRCTWVPNSKPSSHRKSVRLVFSDTPVPKTRSQRFSINWEYVVIEVISKTD